MAPAKALDNISERKQNINNQASRARAVSRIVSMHTIATPRSISALA